MAKPTRSVWVLGLVSFFNDISSEMIYPLLPVFVTQVLGAPVAVLGLIEGASEGSAALFKTIFGRWSDRLGQRKPFVFYGYVVSTVSKVVVALSRTWGLLFVGRVLDKFGKGVRTGARDALLLNASTAKNRGYVFGVQQSLDSAGAVVGPLIALVVLRTTNNDIRTVLDLAVIPSIIGVLVVLVLRDVKSKQTTPVTRAIAAASVEEKGIVSGASSSPGLRLGALPRELRIFLIAIGLFSLGNSSDSFLILRSEGTGLKISLTVAAYVVYNFVYSAASTPAGTLADRFGARRVYVAGVVIYVAVYLGFAINTSTIGVWVLFSFYGLYIALTDSVSRALVGRFITDERQAGGVYGLMQTVISIGLVSASVIGGILWSTVGYWATFTFAAGCATLALAAFLWADLTRPRLPTRA
jgi:MFS family permease